MSTSSELPAWAQPPMRYRPEHGDVVPEEQAKPDPLLEQRALRLLGAGRSVLLVAFFPLALMLLGRAVAGMGTAWGVGLFRGGLLVAVVLVACGAVLYTRYRRLRKRTGYPVPQRVAETVVVAHQAYTALIEILTPAPTAGLNRWTQWRARQECRRVWNDLLQHLDQAERAAQRESNARWQRSVARVERDAAQLLKAAQGFGGTDG